MKDYITDAAYNKLLQDLVVFSGWVSLNSNKTAAAKCHRSTINPQCKYLRSLRFLNAGESAQEQIW